MRVKIIVVLAIAILASWMIAPLLNGNEKAVDLLITLFSILIGFITAAMAMINHNIKDEDNWRQIKYKEQIFHSRVKKYMFIFYLSMSIIILIFFSILLKGTVIYGFIIYLYLQRLYIFLSVIAIIYSFSLFNPLKYQVMYINKLLIEKKPKGLK